MAATRNGRGTSSGEAATLSRLFSSTVVRELGRGRSASFGRLAAATPLSERAGTVGQLFDLAFGVLASRRNRDEYIYRTALVHKILLGVHSIRTAALLNEFRVADTKADVVVLNGTSTAYEIKSERDRLDRLARQVESYRKVFAKVNVIAGANHVEGILRVVPESVGVLVLTNRFSISTVRDAVDRADEIVPDVAFDALRRNEVEGILRLSGATIPKVPNTQAAKALRPMLRRLPPRELHAAMVRVLRESRKAEHLAGAINHVPSSLQAAVLKVRLRPTERHRVVECMRIPMHEALAWAR